MATQMDVALHASVSYMTVSRVVNNSSSVKKETRERVLKAIEELGYYPNSAAQVLAGGQTFNIGIVFPENEYVLSRQYFVELTNRIEGALGSHGYHLFLGAGRTHLGRETLKNLALKGTMDGLVIVSPPVHDDRLTLLASTNFPAVIVHDVLDKGPFSVVDADSLLGTEMAMDHLWQAGHRDIAFVSGNLLEITALDRHKVYREFLARKGKLVRSEWTHEGDWSLESGYAGLKAVMAGAKKPTAVLFSNDQMAIGGLKAAHDTGLRVPHDVAVVGFDNTKYSSFVSPSLTTVDMRIDELARAAVDALLDTIRNGAAPKQVSLPPILIVRESSQKED